MIRSVFIVLCCMLIQLTYCEENIPTADTDNRMLQGEHGSENLEDWGSPGDHIPDYAHDEFYPDKF